MSDKKCNLNELGKRIKIQRKNLKMTQEALAEQIGVARQTLAKWEINEGYPDLVMLTKLCEVFDCESGYLLGEYDCKKKDTADIGGLTGLSEDAVNALIETNSHGLAKDILAILSYLLCVCGQGICRVGKAGDFVETVIYRGLSPIFEQKIVTLNRPLNVFERRIKDNFRKATPEERIEELDIWEKIDYLSEKGYVVQHDETALNNEIDRMLGDFKNIILSSLEMLEEVVHDDFKISQNLPYGEQIQRRALISVYNTAKNHMDFRKAEKERIKKEKRENMTHKKEELNG